MADVLITGHLEPNAESSTASLAGYLVELHYTRLVDRPPIGEVLVPVAAGELVEIGGEYVDELPPVSNPVATLTDLVEAIASTRTNADGRFELSLVAAPEPPSVRFVVSTPAGLTVLDLTVEVEGIGGDVLLRVDAVESVAVETTEEVPPVAFVVLRGSVVDPSGAVPRPGLQVTILARRANDSGNGEPGELLPILVTRTDRAGAFFGNVPDHRYADATATIAGADAPVPVPVVDGRIDKRLLLMPYFPAEEASLSDDKECSCDTAPPRSPDHADFDDSPGVYSTDLGVGCINFNTPNRALEEFDFYSVVRTTEPQVRPVTLPESDRATVAPPDSGADTAQPVIAATYRIALDVRDLGQAGAVRISFITDLGRRYIVVETPGSTVGAVLTALPTQLIPAALAAASQRQDTITVEENSSGVNAIGLDLRSIRKVEVSNGVFDTTGPWAFGGISISATTRAGDTVPIHVAGDEYHELEEELIFNTVLEGPEPAFVADAGIPATSSSRALMRIVGVNNLAAVGVAYPEPQNLTRSSLGRDNAVDWDHTPTLYESADVAHGHLLHFKQVWHADGYSLGDLLYSLPLAPGQKKLISVVDWERRERADRGEETSSREGLFTSVSRDRDLGEVVTGALTESVRGGSRNTTTGVGVGTGAAGNGSYQAFNFGALLGVSGGYGDSESSAWQASGRAAATSSLQTLRDNTLQSASAVRGLRSTVVQTVSQGESTRVTTEVVANHNHCHAMTVQYFEVLRHLKVVHRLADVRECLFVPLPDRALRPGQGLAVASIARGLPPPAGAGECVRRRSAGGDRVVRGRLSEEALRR